MLPKRVSRRQAMLRLKKISAELQELSERRTDLWEQASETGDEALAHEAGSLEERLDALWTTYRWLSSAIRHDSFERIRNRARREEYLLRGLERGLRTR
jgi:galactokinase/mevalonate kinase-like predicted kinase